MDVAHPLRIDGTHLDAAGQLRYVDPDGFHQALRVGIVAVPYALDRFDLHLVAPTAGDDDVAGDVGELEGSVASEPHRAAEAVGVFGAAPRFLVSRGPVGANLSLDLRGVRALVGGKRRGQRDAQQGDEEQLCH
jgi:hypothetical protein